MADADNEELRRGLLELLSTSADAMSTTELRELLAARVPAEVLVAELVYRNLLVLEGRRLVRRQPQSQPRSGRQVTWELRAPRRRTGIPEALAAGDGNRPARPVLTQ